MRRPSSSVRGVLVACALALAVPRDAAAEPKPTPKIRHRHSVHHFSLMMFDDWPIVPEETAGKERTDPLTTYRAARFYRRGKDRRDDVGGGVAEVYVLKPGATVGVTPTPAGQPGSGPPKSVREILVVAASRLGLRNLKLDPEKATSIKSKDGIAGSTWTGPAKGEIHAVFATWSKDGTEVGAWIACARPVEEHFALGFSRVLSSFLWDDERAEDAKSLPALEGVRISAERRREIERGLVRGWDVLVSPRKNYVLVYNTKNGKNNSLARRVAERIEALRSDVYEKQFPPARPIQDVAIVRVCADRVEYHAYGGPGMSAGYWNEDAEELVFFDASPLRAVDDDTLSVLYHEAFHQYIHYAVGRLAPHPWFNEGHGDYYAGARFDAAGKVSIKPFAWRVRPARLSIGLDSKEGNVTAVPLKELVAMDQRAYYAKARICYPQGWSLVYFLREVVPKNPDWNAKWGSILDRYFKALQEEVVRASSAPPTTTPSSGGKPGPGPGGGGDAPPAPPPPSGGDGDGEGGASGVPVVMREQATSERALARALEVAFEGVDFDALEAAWKESLAKIQPPKRR